MKIAVVIEGQMNLSYAQQLAAARRARFLSRLIFRAITRGREMLIAAEMPSTTRGRTKVIRETGSRRSRFVATHKVAGLVCGERLS